MQSTEAELDCWNLPGAEFATHFVMEHNVRLAPNQTL